MFKKVIGGLVAAMGLLSGSIQYSVSAQSKYMDQYCMPDPQVWGMIKYSGQTPDLYTGTVRAEIPIYTYSDPDFEIPVSLTYASNGYMPNTQANFVGLGWSLNAGGCITRRVQGIRDELEDNTMKGYYDYIKDGFSSDFAYDSKLGCIGNNITYVPIEDLSHYETEPDIFMFNFLGYSGKFIIDTSGKARVFDTNVPCGEITVDISGLDNNWPDSYIKIETGDGYSYTFGGLREFVGKIDNNATTIIHSQHPKTSTGHNDPNNSDTWYLKKIVAPNGRNVSFSYLIDNDTRMQTYEPIATYMTVASADMDAYTGSIMTSLDGGWVFASSSANSWVIERIRHLTLPHSIKIDNDFEITFSYTARQNEKGILHAQYHELYTPKKLSGITATDLNSGAEIMNASLSYKYPASAGNQVIMLSKVNVSGLGEYLMEYYKEDSSFPDIGSYAIDHWGYYNSSDATDAYDMLPDINLDPNYIEKIMSDNRNPDPTKSMTGMLKSIRYPTGGYTKYKYEAHDYSKIVVRNSLTRGRFRLNDLTSSAVAGGLRLKEIVDSAATGALSRRLFEYVSDDDKSSGIMMDFPRYCMCCIKDTVINGTQSYEYKNTMSSSCPGYLLDNTYIGYSSVREIYGDGSSKVTRFTSWEEFPDVLDDNDPIPAGIGLSKIDYIDFTYPAHFYNITRTPTSAASLRGKVQKQIHYDVDGGLLQIDSMKYSATWEDLDYMKSLKLTADSIYVHHTLCESPRLSSKSVKYPDGTLKTETYEYNSKDQIRRVNKMNSDDSQYSTYYFYPQDIASSDRTTEEQEMVENNVISEPAYVVNTHKRGAVEKIVSAVHTLFDKIGSSLMPMFVKGSEHIAETVSDQSVVSSAQAVLDKVKSLPYKTLFTWNEYNSMGRPCHVTDTDGVSSLIIWGYDGLYPVALLRNVTPSLFDSTVHSTGAYKTVMGWNGLSAVNESTFRGIKNSAVTVWGWKPFVGMTKVTGPDSRTMTYSYDSFGRLESVTGSDGNINSKYTYKLK